jgi:hypothetical protein
VKSWNHLTEAARFDNSNEAVAFRRWQFAKLSRSVLLIAQALQFLSDLRAKPCVSSLAEAEDDHLQPKILE